MSRSIDLERLPGANPDFAMSEMSAASAPLRPALSPWIVNRWQDMLLFIATPLLIVPIVTVALTQFTVEQISLFVIAFGAGGHHLPGMMRAYGDRALFRQFKTRFIAAPIFLLAFCIAFAQWDLNGLFMLLLLWGFWHGLMQVYGFVRIYDAKVGSFGKLTARLDWWLCLAWFGLGLILSPSRMGDMLDTFYKAGGPFISPAAIVAAQNSWMALTAVATVFFLANFVQQRRLGRPANPIKLLIMGTSFAFWWYTQVHITNILLGIALFEIFHDVQYLSIVWVFNRKRVANDPNVGIFTRLLFRPSTLMMAVYVVLCFLYGGAFLLGNVVDMQTSRNALFGFGAASTFLHFYFDGFIWKVREKSTRAALGLQGGASAAEIFPGWLTHGAKWMLFIVPACVLWYSEVYRRAPVVERYQKIVEAVPDCSAIFHRLGLALKDRGDANGALAAFDRALELDPALADAHLDLGDLLHSRGQKDEALYHYERAIESNSRSAKAHFRLGMSLQADGRSADAEEHLSRALELKPQYADAHFALASLLQKQGRTDEAIEHLRAATTLNPDFTEANLALGNLLQVRQRSASNVQ